MADISMCKGDKCPLTASCLRFNAIPNMEYQAFSKFVYDQIKKQCDYYIEQIKPSVEEEDLN